MEIPSRRPHLAVDMDRNQCTSTIAARGISGIDRVLKKWADRRRSRAANAVPAPLLVAAA
jgi:hypothetical protein